jgi:hypothetical protein
MRSLAFLIILLLSNSLLSAEPVKVLSGIFILDIHDIDIKNETFKADFYYWISWNQDKAPKNFDPTSFEIMNGAVEIKSTEKSQRNGISWVSFRCDGLFRAKFNFKDYPADKQTLMIEIENSRYDADELIYEPEKDALQKKYKISTSGWEMDKPIELRVENFNYESNFGNPNRSQTDVACYSRFMVLIPLRHSAAFWTYLKLFLPVYISVCIAFLTFLIEPTDLDPRFGVGIAAIFGAVSSLIVANTSIPDTCYFSLSDKIHLISLGFIFTTVLSSCLILKICKTCKNRLVYKIDLTVGGTLFFIYCLTIFYVTMLSLW